MLIKFSEMWLLSALSHQPETSVDADTVHALARNARELHKAYARLKRETKETFDEMKALFRQVRQDCFGGDLNASKQ